MILAKDIGRGSVVELDGIPCLVEKVTVQTPSARGASTLYKVRAKNLLRPGKVDKTLKGMDALAQPEFSKRPVQFLYREKDGFVFMDLGDYDQFSLHSSDVEQEAPWLADGMQGICSMVLDGRIIGIELPDTVDVQIVECTPAARGDSATGRQKPAIIPSGATVLIPEYLSPGETIRVDTRTGKFVSRA